MWMLMLLLAAFMAAPASAQTFPQLTGRVVDQANLLTPEQEADLAAKSQALETQSGRQFVVATVSSLEGREIEDYGYRLGRHWGLGNEKRDDGVILLIAPNERKVRIETGYGARVFLTDAVSSIIIRETILPRFKAGDMPGGIVAGADKIIETMRLPPDQAARNAEAAQAQQEQSQASREGGGFPFFFVILIFFFVVLPMLRAAGGRKRRYHSKRRGGIDPFVVLWGLNEISRSSRGGGGWGGGGGFGGFGGGGGGFSGGGGSFGGGGASGGW